MSWALIIGGSKGIGRGIAEAIARRNYDLILVARDEEELIKAKNQLMHDFPVQVDILSCDLSKSDGIKIIYDWCTKINIDIKILCHVAGFGGPKDFGDLPLEDLGMMMRVNFESVVESTWHFLQQLKKNTPSFILHVSSMAAFSPMPQKNIYSASKSALLFFSCALNAQLRQDHISVSCLCPGPVFTNPGIETETIKHLGWIGKQMAIAPAPLGEYTVRKMLKGKMIIIPGKLNQFISFLLQALPHKLLIRIFYRGKPG
ncbi:MAG: SDR family NAD(P)-dependent oxidoreductase [Chitinophagales bacterium]